MTVVRIKTKKGGEVDVQVDESPLNVEICVKKAILSLDLTEREIASARVNPRDD